MRTRVTASALVAETNWASARCRPLYPAVLFPGCAPWTPAADAGLPHAEAADLPAGLAELSFVAELGAVLTSARFLRPVAAGLRAVLTSARFHFPFAAVVHEGRLARFAGSMVVGWNAGSLAVRDVSPAGLPVLRVEQPSVQAHFVLVAPDSVGAPQGRAVGELADL